MRRGQERGRREPLPMGEKRFLQELHQVASGLFACRDCRPNALAPSAALFTTRALRGFPVENDKSNCLFGQIVGRVNTGRGNELEERVAVLAKPLRHILRLTRCWDSFRRLGDNRFPGGSQTTFGRLLGEFVAAMKRAEHFANSVEQALAV